MHHAKTFSLVENLFQISGVSNSHFCYWKAERWNSTLRSQFRLAGSTCDCDLLDCTAVHRTASQILIRHFNAQANNNVILWSSVELHMTCLHVKSSSGIESVIVESCMGFYFFTPRFCFLDKRGDFS